MQKSKAKMEIYIIILFIALGRRSACNETKQQRVILISVDGLRWDYKDYKDYKMENLRKIIQNGVTVDHVKNVFPTNTYPNHQSMVTGLYPENHGIIDNTMFDENNGTIFKPGVKEERWWNKAEPLWITNQKQGYQSGTGYWPGSDVTINGTVPSFTLKGMV